MDRRVDSPIDVTEISFQSVVDQSTDDTLDLRDKLPELVASAKGKISAVADPESRPLQLPEISSSISTSSLVQKMGLAEDGERSLGSLLHLLHSNVLGALEEVRTVTTHDNNLETQYRETLSENVKLKAALNRARRELSHLKGRLSVLELTAADIREEHNRKLQTRQRMSHQESNLQQRTQKKEVQKHMHVPSFQERSLTVDSRGRYIQRSREVTHFRKKHPTFPQRTLPAIAIKTESLPPPMHGCNCSVCNSLQSMGALTIGKMAGRSCRSKSGQQILLGDRVVITGDKIGCVRYIGKLEFDPSQRLFIGIHLDSPVGVCDGAIRSRRYFQCPQSHGVFVLPKHILCVTGRRPFPASTAVPRVRKGLPSASQEDETPTPKKVTETQEQVDSPLSSTPSALTHARTLLQEELDKLMEGTSPSQLVDPSITEMSKRMIDLQGRPRQTLTPDPESEEEVQEKELDQEVLSASHKVEGGPPAEEPREEPDSGQEQEKPMDTAPEALATDQPETKQDSSTEVTKDTDDEPSLVTRLVSVLEDKDLGSTGFVTVNELVAALLSEFQLNQDDVETVMNELGLQDAEGRGIEYTGLTQDIAQAIERLQDHPENTNTI